jgi:hypothetical protein
MSRHNAMPPVPPANRSHKGTGDDGEVNRDTATKKAEENRARPLTSGRTPPTLASSREDASNKATVMMVLGASEGPRVVLVVEDEFLQRMLAVDMVGRRRLHLGRGCGRDYFRLNLIGKHGVEPFRQSIRFSKVLGTTRFQKERDILG